MSDKEQTDKFLLWFDKEIAAFHIYCYELRNISPQKGTFCCVNVLKSDAMYSGEHIHFLLCMYLLTTNPLKIVNFVIDKEIIR